MKPTEPSHESAPAGEISRLAEHLFREESGRLISVLTGMMGLERLQLAEDVVQEALVRALKVWPYYGIPPNPAAWLTQTAKNLALDVLRREKRFREKQPDIVDRFQAWAEAAEAVSGGEEIQDHRLRLIFACCHPQIPPEMQTALALKTLCGFGVREIASAFLISDAAVAKRLTRAKERIREQQVPLEIPAGPELPARMDGVLQTLYLLFNEGYKASSGDRLVNEELCREAIRLIVLVSDHPATNQPRVHALAALMMLNASRLPARVDDAGNILLLKNQDRASWDRALIQRGMLHLNRSMEGADLTEYHLQAGIAAQHATAPDYEATNWVQILALYDQLIRRNDSPVVALNRAVALAHVEGPAAGVAAVESIPHRGALDGYYLYHGVLAELEFQRQQWKKAAGHFKNAIALASLKSERQFLQMRLEACARNP